LVITGTLFPHPPHTRQMRFVSFGPLDPTSPSKGCTPCWTTPPVLFSRDRRFFFSLPLQLFGSQSGLSFYLFQPTTKSPASFYFPLSASNFEESYFPHGFCITHRFVFFPLRFLPRPPIGSLFIPPVLEEVCRVMSRLVFLVRVFCLFFPRPFPEPPLCGPKNQRIGGVFQEIGCTMRGATSCLDGCFRQPPNLQFAARLL